MKFLIVKDYTGLWEAEYRTAGMKNSDNESVVAIKSRRYVNGAWVENYTDIDDQMIALGLPNHLGYRFNEAQMTALAASKNLTLIKKYEMDTPVVLNQGLSEYALIESFVLAEQTGDAVIDHELETIDIEVAFGTTVTALEPTVVVSEGATVDPESGEATDFTLPVEYTVTAEDGITEKVYTVTVTVASE